MWKFHVNKDEAFKFYDLALKYVKMMKEQLCANKAGGLSSTLFLL